MDESYCLEPSGPEAVQDCPWLQKPPNFPLIWDRCVSPLHTPRCHLGLNQGQREKAKTRNTGIYLKELSKETVLLNQEDFIGLH